MILRFLFGAIAEAWEMVKRPIHQKLIGHCYLPLLDPNGIVAYEALKNHFGSSNLLHRLRNTLVFPCRLPPISTRPSKMFRKTRIGPGIPRI
jgi:hypothetical protein